MCGKQREKEVTAIAAATAAAAAGPLVSSILLRKHIQEDKKKEGKLTGWACLDVRDLHILFDAPYYSVDF